MGKLKYLITTSLDGYAIDKNGDFDWAMPSEESHTFVNDTMRSVGTYVFGRKMYETMKVWDTMPVQEDSEAMNDFAKLWRTQKKIVYSTTLSEVTTADTTLEHTFDPSVFKKLVAESDKDVSIGGPNLAAEAIRAGIVDEYHQIIAPIIIGGGRHWLPADVRLELKLVDARNFQNGFVHLQYDKI